MENKIKVLLKEMVSSYLKMMISRLFEEDTPFNATNTEDMFFENYVKKIMNVIPSNMLPPDDTGGNANDR